MFPFTFKRKRKHMPTRDQRRRWSTRHASATTSTSGYIAQR